MSDLPQRRSDGVIERTLDGETVVYDLDGDRITHLDAATAAVWRSCDGDTDLDGVAAASGQSRAQVADALVRLDDAGLMASGLSRRQLLARAGAVAWVVPLVSIAAPTAATAASPSIPVVGTIRHTCVGAHTQTFTIPVEGLPPGTQVTLNFAINPGSTYSQSRTTSTSGTATFSQTFGTTGPPVSSRTVTVTSVSFGGQTYPLSVTPYTGTCP